MRTTRKPATKATTVKDRRTVPSNWSKAKHKLSRHREFARWA